MAVVSSLQRFVLLEIGSGSRRQGSSGVGCCWCFSGRPRRRGEEAVVVGVSAFVQVEVVVFFDARALAGLGGEGSYVGELRCGWWWLASEARRRLGAWWSWVWSMVAVFVQ